MDHPITKALQLIDESIAEISSASGQDIKIYQDLELKQKGYGSGKMVANQGNIQINIVNQTVLLNLMEIKSALQNTKMIKVNGEMQVAPDKGLKWNVRQFKAEMVRKAIVACGSKLRAARMLKIDERSVTRILEEVEDRSRPKNILPLVMNLPINRE